MSEKPLLIDTQALLWWVLGDERLTDVAHAAMQDDIDAGEQLLVSAWSIVELGYGTEKPVGNPGRIESGDLAEVVAVLNDDESEFDVVPVDLQIAQRVRLVPREWNADPWDRTIVATAQRIGATLVTSDTVQRSNPEIDTLW